MAKVPGIALTKNSAGIGKEASKTVRQRRGKLAAITGRSSLSESKSGCEQARRELTGEPDTDPKNALLESAPESGRWDPVPGSAGHLVPAAPSDDEDDEGRSDNEQLVEEGVVEAEHDHMVQAARAAEKKDGREP